MDKAWCIQQGDWDGTEASYEKLNNPAADAEPLHKIMMGTGPFTFNYWNQGTEIAFNRNDNYWGTKANFKSFVSKMFQSGPTENSRLKPEMLTKSTVHIPQYSEMEGVSGITVYQNLPR